MWNSYKYIKIKQLELSIPTAAERFLLISIAEIMFTLVFLFFFKSQESMVLPQLQLAYLHYHELSLTFLQNIWLTPLKNQKVEKQQQQNR